MPIKFAAFLGIAALAFLAAPLPAAALDRLPGNAAELSLIDGPLAPQDRARAERIANILTGIKLPPGFRIALYGMAPGARGLALHPDGDIVIVSTNQARLFAMRDMGKTGVADDIRLFAPGIAFTQPHGVCFAGDGALYVAELNRVLTFPDVRAQAGSAAAGAFVVVPGGKLIPGQEESGGHSARICRIGPDNRLYVSLGQPYNVPPPEKTELYQRLGIGGIAVALVASNLSATVYLVAAGVVGTGEGWLTELSTAQLKDLFALEKTAVSE